MREGTNEQYVWKNAHRSFKPVVISALGRAAPVVTIVIQMAGVDG